MLPVCSWRCCLHWIGRRLRVRFLKFVAFTLTRTVATFASHPATNTEVELVKKREKLWSCNATMTNCRNWTSVRAPKRTGRTDRRIAEDWNDPCFQQSVPRCCCCNLRLSAKYQNCFHLKLKLKQPFQSKRHKRWPISNRQIPTNIWAPKPGILLLNLNDFEVMSSLIQLNVCTQDLCVT